MQILPSRLCFDAWPGVGAGTVAQPWAMHEHQLVHDPIFVVTGTQRHQRSFAGASFSCRLSVNRCPVQPSATSWPRHRTHRPWQQQP